MKQRVTDLFGTEVPVVQAGMIWCSGWELAAAVSEAGGLGLIGAGSMYPEVLRTHIRKAQTATDKPFGVNLPLLYPDIEAHVASIVELGVRVVFTSAGNPKTWTGHLQAHGIRVVHVVSSVKFALKAEDAGVDAVVAEGFEAGGHNGREETTTLCLVPAVADACAIPVWPLGASTTGVPPWRRSRSGPRASKSAAASSPPWNRPPTPPSKRGSSARRKATPRWD